MNIFFLFALRLKNPPYRKILFIIWPIVSAIPIFLFKHILKINVLFVVLFCKACLQMSEEIFAYVITVHLSRTYRTEHYVFKRIL